MPFSSRMRRKRLRDVLGFLRIHARGRFVEQQQQRIGGQGPGDLQPPLSAVGQIFGQFVAHARKADIVHQLHGPALRILFLFDEGGQAEQDLEAGIA